MVQGHNSERSNRSPGTNAGLTQSAEVAALEAARSAFESPVQHHGRLPQRQRDQVEGLASGSSNLPPTTNARVAQRTERRASNPTVGSWNLSGSTNASEW